MQELGGFGRLAKKSLDASVTTASGMFNSSDVNLVEIVRPALWVSIDSLIFRQ